MMSFRDYVAMERQVLESQEFRRFWDKKLQDCVPLKLPRWPASLSNQEFIEREDDELLAVSQLYKWPVRSGKGARQKKLDFPIRNDVIEGLKRFARAANVPIKSILLAAHLKVMSILGGQADIITGLLFNGRPEVVDGADVRGLFLNTLPFRLNLSDVTWMQLVQKTFEAEQELLPLRRYPMAALQKAWGQEPIFETLFTYLHFHEVERAIGSGKAEILDDGNIDWGETNFTLMTIFHKGPFPASFPHELILMLTFDIEILCIEQVKRIYGYYDRVLRSIASEPYCRHQAQSFLSPMEQNQLLIEWNNTRVDYPRQRSIHQIFEAQVERSPEAIAVIFGDEQLTYLELNVRANRLAHHLHGLGVEPEARVAICLERGVKMVVALLAVLKAGGAYVPLDPAYPRERLGLILEDARAPVLLTQERLIAGLPEHGARVVCLDVDWEAIAVEEKKNPVSSVKASNLAYVIYTSGSTGRPKGVAIEHRNVSALIHWAKEVFTAEDLRGVLASTSICFDLSVFELFVTLSWGGKVILAENALQLPGLPAANEVTLVNTVPSAMAELVRMGGIPASVRTVNLAGELLRTRMVEDIYSQETIRRVFDLYGPSEDTTYSTFALRSATGPATIGRPIANTEIYLLDPCMQPVPAGVVGQLYISGDGLARGYLQRPDLTAEKWIPNPFSVKPGLRLYNTGDLARHLPSGNLEFLGRSDRQVKIHGFRIELGEVEARLAEHPGVSEAVVLVREDGEAGKRMVAFYTGEEIAAEALRAHLSSVLPKYMIPAAYVHLESLPLMPNGKIDRRALPAPTDEAYVRHGYEPPVGEVDTWLARIWADLLKVERVGRHDNFFELGGHSLLATLLVGRIKQEMAVDIPLADVFKFPNLAMLTECIVTAQLAQFDADDLAQVIAALDAS